MSRLRANQITNKTANGAPTATNGFIVTGVCTATSFVGNGANLTGIDATSIKHTDGSVKAQAVATGVNVTGNLSVSGVLTYDDVTNVDSVGIITARNGINCTTDGVGKGINIGAGQDLIIQHNGTNSFIDNNTGDLLYSDYRIW